MNTPLCQGAAHLMTLSKSLFADGRMSPAECKRMLWDERYLGREKFDAGSRRSRRRFVSNSANTPSMSRKHLPAAVLVSIAQFITPRRRDSDLMISHPAERSAFSSSWRF